MHRLDRRIAVAAALLLAACRDAAVTERRIEEAEARWRETGVASYAIEVTMSDGRDLERKVAVTVRDGAIAGATFREDAVERALNETQAHPYTVEGLFGILARELETGRRRFVRAWFHEELGYPELIELGPFRDGPSTGGARFLRVDRFEPDRPGARHPPHSKLTVS